MAFRFLQFEVEDRHSTLRVGTDAMLLGAWARPPMQGRILDLGTGCGVLALMMAQRSKATIDAIDVDLPSVEEATMNFGRSPWASRLHAFQGDAGELIPRQATGYSFLITNPPWFSASLRSPSPRRNRARHDDLLPLSELPGIASRLLAPSGTVALIIPLEEQHHLVDAFREKGYFPSRSLTVYPKPGKKGTRILFEFSRNAPEVPETGELAILGEDGKFTPAYLALTREFHCFNG